MGGQIFGFWSGFLRCKKADVVSVGCQKWKIGVMSFMDDPQARKDTSIGIFLHSSLREKNEVNFEPPLNLSS